jgi:hypothetical protein
MKFLTSVLLTFAIVFGSLSFSCTSDKALKTIREADNKLAQLLIYVRNIAKANNDAFAKGDIPSAVHKPLNDGAAAALKGLQAVAKAIADAKAAVKGGASASGQLDIIKTIFSTSAEKAVLDLIALATAVPAGLASQITGYTSLLQTGIAVFKAFFAEFEQEVNNNATA